MSIFEIRFKFMILLIKLINLPILINFDEIVICFLCKITKGITCSDI